LETPVDANDPDIHPIGINFDSEIPVAGDTLKVYGFGVTGETGLPRALQEADVLYISNQECRQTIAESGIANNIPPIPDDVLCTTIDPNFEAGTSDTSICNGDSGGPLTTYDGSKLVGVVSFGARCSAKIVPNGYVRVSLVSSWIQEQICLYSNEPPPDCPPPTPRDPNAVQLSIVFNHDFYTQETTYSIRSDTDGAIVYSGPQYVPSRNTQSRANVYLLPGEYTFEVYDKGNNGLRSEGEEGDDGSWALYALYDGETETELATGDANFESLQLTDFVVSPLVEGMVEEVQQDTLMGECLVMKEQEEFFGDLFGTICECEKQNGNSQIDFTCFNANNIPCSVNYGTCTENQDCCSGRRCSNGMCRSLSNDGDNKDNSKLENGMGGAAGGRAEERSGYFRGTFDFP
jgi:hypothetical protein